jgi:hypothetical protein
MSHLQDINYHETINEYAEEYQAELKEQLKLKRYHHQLKMLWLDLIERYPETYTIFDYNEACKKTNQLIF